MGAPTIGPWSRSSLQGFAACRDFAPRIMNPMSNDQIPEEEPAHDVLAAEEFALPAPDPAIHHGPVALPEDPTGLVEAHDVLAAEEFAMPAPRPPSAATLARRRRTSDRILASGGAGALLLLWLLRRVFRRR